MRHIRTITDSFSVVEWEGRKFEREYTNIDGSTSVNWYLLKNNSNFRSEIAIDKHMYDKLESEWNQLET